MSQYKTNAQIKDRAKDMLTGKYHAVTLFTLLYHMITTALQTFLTSVSITLVQMVVAVPAFNNTLLANIILNLLCFGIVVLLGVFDVGLKMYFMYFACGGQYESNNLYYGFQYDFKKSLLLSLITSTISGICISPALYLLYQQQMGERTLIFTFITVFLLGVIVSYALTLSISQIFFLMLDFPDMGVKELLKHSRQIMKGHKMRLWKLRLSFLPLSILGILSFGIGFIWVIPYQTLSTTLFYLDLMKPQK